MHDVEDRLAELDESRRKAWSQFYAMEREKDRWMATAQRKEDEFMQAAEALMWVTWLLAEDELPLAAGFLADRAGWRREKAMATLWRFRALAADEVARDDRS